MPPSRCGTSWKRPDRPDRRSLRAPGAVVGGRTRWSWALGWWLQVGRGQSSPPPVAQAGRAGWSGAVRRDAMVIRARIGSVRSRAEVPAPPLWLGACN